MIEKIKAMEYGPIITKKTFLSEFCGSCPLNRAVVCARKSKPFLYTHQSKIFRKQIQWHNQVNLSTWQREGIQEIKPCPSLIFEHIFSTGPVQGKTFVVRSFPRENEL